MKTLSINFVPIVKVTHFKLILRSLQIFYVNLANDRRLSFSTLAGYCSAISLFLLNTGEYVGHDIIISQLMQSFKRTQPVAAGRIPE